LNRQPSERYWGGPTLIVDMVVEEQGQRPGFRFDRFRTPLRW